MLVHGVHDRVLVMLSVAIAVAASYTALDLAGRVRASEGNHRTSWLATASVAMGGGIWAMHFVAMLAMSMPGLDVSYDPGMTVLSLLVAIVATGISFSVAGGRRRSMGRFAFAGILMGSGVAAMHYMGMAAMRMGAAIRYDPAWFSISVLIAVGAATAALWMAARNSSARERVIAAVVMGAAISGMHYAGMQAATFVATSDMVMGSDGGLGRTVLGLGVSVAAFMILLMALIASVFDRRFADLARMEAAALRRSEERFRSLYYGTPLPLYSLDGDARIEQVSKTWLDMMGYHGDDVLARPLVNFMTEASARSFMTRDWPELVRSGFLDDCEYRFVTKSGQVLDVVASARIERDVEGNFLHVLGGMTDVTGRRKAEEALRQAQKVEAIGHLTGGVAHDFNNLLAIVIGNLDLLRRRVPEEPKLMRLIDGAMEGARRGASLTQRLLAFARRQDLRPEPVDVPALVNGMSDLLQRSLGPMISIETRFSLGLPSAQVDAHQLEMALLNLAVNARDAMPEGGVLTVRASSEFVGSVGSEGMAEGRYVRIAVSDVGCGMDEETLARASEPFFTTKGIGKGTGLGLSMAQGLAAQSGGRMSIESELGRGTTVELWLPVAQQAPVKVQAEGGSDPQPEAVSRRILVVDDDALVLGNTAAMLEDLGHEVVKAESGAEALRIVKEGLSLDLIVTDQLMPGMTGTQLADEVRAVNSSLPILLVSGFLDLQPGARRGLPLLGKPFDQAALDKAVRSLPVTRNVVSIRARPGSRRG